MPTLHDWRIPFGKYRGQKLAGIPTPYLEWLAGRALWSSTAAAIDAELQRRRTRGRRRTSLPAASLPPRPQRITPVTLGELIDVGRMLNDAKPESSKVVDLELYRRKRRVGL